MFAVVAKVTERTQRAYEIRELTYCLAPKRARAGLFVSGIGLLELSRAWSGARLAGLGREAIETLGDILCGDKRMSASS
jgi:hypothetical protein